MNWFGSALLGFLYNASENPFESFKVAKLPDTFCQTQLTSVVWVWDLAFNP